MDHPKYQGLRFAWARGCWFPEWIEVEFHEQAGLGEGSEVRPITITILSSLIPHYF
jgi:hypothetical protein